MLALNACADAIAGSSLMDRTAQQVENRNSERFALQIPQRDIERGNRKTGDAAVVAVPPRMVFQAPPQCIGVHRILTDEQRRHPVDDGFRCQRCLSKLCDGLAPADLSVIPLQANQAQVTLGVAIIGFRIRNRNRLDGANAHANRSPLNPSGGRR